METKDLHANILSGVYDADLERLTGAIKDRQRAVRDAAGADLLDRISENDLVRISESAQLRPRKLMGITLKVDKLNRKTATVIPVEGELPPGDKWNSGFRVGAGYLEVVNSQ